jgi:hypothetical protein
MTGSSGRSSTPRSIGSSTTVSGILDRPDKPGDDTEVCRLLEKWIVSSLQRKIPLQFVASASQ